VTLLRDRNLHVVFGVTLMAVLGVSSIAPALPQVARAFDLSAQQVGLLITVFTLPGVILTPLTGLLADRYGRRRILAPSLLLFALGGGACALATSASQLMVLRLVQGIGGAALGSLNATVLGDLYQGRQRAAAMGYNSSVLSIGTASYPALGGGLAEFGWRWPFLLPLLALPVAAAVWFCLRYPQPVRRQPLREYFDAVGRSLRRRAVAGLFAVSTLTFILLYGGMLTYLPVLMDERFGLSPGRIGIFLTTSSLTTALVSTQLGRLSERCGEGRLIRIAFGLYALALALVPFLPSAWFVLLPAACFGAGMGLNMPSLLTLLAGLAPPHHRGAFMALNGTVLRLGQTLGPLLGGVAYGLGGVEAVFLSGAAIAVLALALVGVTVPARNEGPDGA
jgi:predicted MFS family arabinose efflux permease